MSRTRGYIKAFSTFIILVLAVVVAGQQPSLDLLVIDHINIIDGKGGQIIRDGAIVVEGGRITQIGERGNIKAPSQNILNARGKWAIPGLIDAHIHFDQSSNIYSRPDVIDFRNLRPYAAEIDWVRARMPMTLQRYVASGVTGVVDMGGPLWSYDVRATAERTPNAPRVALAGWLISTHAVPKLESNDPPIVVVDTPERGREIVRRQLERHPDFMKFLFLHESGDDLERQTEIARAIIEEAHKNMIRVAVHATELETAKAALRAGADVLVHSVEDMKIDSQFVNLARTRNVLYIPTLQVLEGYYEVLSRKVSLSDIERRLGDPQVIQSWSDLAKLPADQIPYMPNVPQPAKRPVYFDNLQLLDTMGIRIAAGSDAGNIGTLHGPALHRELELMVEAGMRPIDALGAATRNGAAVMGRESEVGTLEKGKVADLVILDANPAADIQNTRKIFRVMKGGKFITVDENALK